MSDINRVIFIGRLTNDPVVKATKSGADVCGFSLASNKVWKDDSGEKKERVTFARCSAWNGIGKVISDYAKKGQRICVEGELQSHEWEEEGKKRSALEIKVENFQFLDTKKNNDDNIPL